MLKPLPLIFFILLCLTFFACKQDFPVIGVVVKYLEGDIHISNNGKILRTVHNERSSPIELQFELNSMVSFDIDSLNRIVYINNYAKDLLAISIDKGQILHKTSLAQLYTYAENTHAKLKNKEFHVVKYKDKVLLITHWDVLVFDEDLHLQKKLLDSVAVENPRLLKGFMGSFDYSLEGDSITLAYRIKAYRYGLNDLEKPVIIEDYTFKL